MISKSVVSFTWLLAAVLTTCAPNHDKTATTERKMFALLEKFDRFDDNGDSYLTRRELEAGVKAANTMLVTAEQYDQVMKAYDTNKDQKISLREAQIGAGKGPEIFSAE